MFKKILPLILILVLVSAGSIWLMKKKNIPLRTDGYNPALDSIFYNITFGMTRQAFYDTCWRLNKTGEFMEGGNNLSVQHKIKSELGKPVNMNFFPVFANDILFQMPVVYHYESWAPWNRELYSDSLIVRVATKFEKDYNIKFSKKKTPDGRPAYFNYTGPRKILLTTQDEQYVKVLMENAKYK